MNTNNNTIECSHAKKQSSAVASMNNTMEIVTGNVEKEKKGINKYLYQNSIAELDPDQKFAKAWMDLQS